MAFATIHFMRAIVFTLLMTAISLYAAEKNMPNLAVLDLSASQGVTASDASLIADRLETEFIKRNQFQVLERRRMDDILQEQGFQQSGACDNSNCEVQMGQLLGVDRLVSGSLGKIGSVYTLNVKLLDVASGRILDSRAIDIEGDLSLVLTQGCAQIAKQLASDSTDNEKVTSLSSHKGWWIAGGVALLTAAGIGTYMVLSDDNETRNDVRTLE